MRDRKGWGETQGFGELVDCAAAVTQVEQRCSQLVMRRRTCGSQSHGFLEIIHRGGPLTSAAGLVGVLLIGQCTVKQIVERLQQRIFSNPLIAALLHDRKSVV